MSATASNDRRELAALDAFNHPYAYGPTQRVRSAPPSNVAVTR